MQNRSDDPELPCLQTNQRARYKQAACVSVFWPEPCVKGEGDVLRSPEGGEGGGGGRVFAIVFLDGGGCSSASPALDEETIREQNTYSSEYIV